MLSKIFIDYMTGARTFPKPFSDVFLLIGLFFFFSTAMVSDRQQYVLTFLTHTWKNPLCKPQRSVSSLTDHQRPYLSDLDSAPDPKIVLNLVLLAGPENNISTYKYILNILQFIIN